MDNLEYNKTCANIMINDMPFVCDRLGVTLAEYFEMVPMSKVSIMATFITMGKIQKSSSKEILDFFYQGFSFIDAVAPFYIQEMESSELYALIDVVFAENPEQYEKFKKDEKLVNWFVGQVMKKSTTKLQAMDVKTALMEKRE